MLKLRERWGSKEGVDRWQVDPVLTGESNGPSSRKGGKKPWKARGRTRGKDGDQKKESTDGQTDPVLELWERWGSKEGVD